jgi:tRNA pseudouridine38-40 synthase
VRIALGISYNGQPYQGWQSQSTGLTIQDKLEKALKEFTTQKVTTLCAGRTDAGVHGLMQVVHFDTPLERDMGSWVRGTNRYLPDDISVQWAQEVPTDFHARGSALARRYAYILLESPVRPSLEAGRAGWIYRALDEESMQKASKHLLANTTFPPSEPAVVRPCRPSKL